MQILALPILVVIGLGGGSNGTAPEAPPLRWSLPQPAMLSPAPLLPSEPPTEPGSIDQPIFGWLPSGEAARALDTPAEPIDPACDGEEACQPPPDRASLEPDGNEHVLSSYYDPFSRQLAYGINRYQRYRFGWYSYDDFTYLPTAPVRGTTGSFQDLEWNSSVRYSRPLNNRAIFAWTPSWNTRWITGPSGVALAGHLNQIASDFQWSSALPGPLNWQLGATPQLNSDFSRQLDSNAYMVDGRAVLLYQPSVTSRIAVGAELWDRVHEELIPYGGVDWMPNDFWEFRLFFPKTRVSRYWGRVWGNQLWTYATSEYNSQAYQVDIADTRAKQRMELRDDQLLAGVSAQHNCWTAFTEAGTIVARSARFSGPTSGFNIHDALVARVGILY